MHKQFSIDIIGDIKIEQITKEDNSGRREVRRANNQTQDRTSTYVNLLTNLPTPNQLGEYMNQANMTRRYLLLIQNMSIWSSIAQYGSFPAFNPASKGGKIANTP